MKIKSVKNIRDLGGFLVGDKRTKNNTFIRSETITHLTDEESNYLISNNIKTNIDLRTKEECKRKVSFFQNDKRFNYHNIVLLGDGIPKRKCDIAPGYLEIINDKDNIKEVLNILINEDNGIIVNCTSGKDRTGVITMLILLICGVNSNDIIADYSVSQIYLKDKLRAMHINNPKMPKWIGNSDFINMEETLKLFFDKYKSIDNYLDFLGISKEDVLKLKNKFIE